MILNATYISIKYSWAKCWFTLIISIVRWKIGPYFLCPFVLILRQAQHKYKRTKKSILDWSRSAQISHRPIHEKSDKLRLSNDKRFSVSLTLRNFLHPLFANQDSGKTNSDSNFYRTKMFKFITWKFSNLLQPFFGTPLFLFILVYSFLLRAKFPFWTLRFFNCFVLCWWLCYWWFRSSGKN